MPISRDILFLAKEPIQGFLLADTQIGASGGKLCAPCGAPRATQSSPWVRDFHFAVHVFNAKSALFRSFLQADQEINGIKHLRYAGAWPDRAPTGLRSPAQGCATGATLGTNGEVG
ncbi:MAG: hypothetical protein EA401_14500, partial [Planctomycetota bacterium]